MTATVTRIAISDPTSATTPPTEGAGMVEPVPLLDEWVAHGFVQMKEAQEDAFTAIDTVAQMCSKAAQASTACHLRMVEIAYANADAALGLWRALTAAQTVEEFITASADGARRQVETAASQLHELSGLAGKVATETTEPISAKLSRALQQAA
jgi:hypothetical protein